MALAATRYESCCGLPHATGWTQRSSINRYGLDAQRRMLREGAAEKGYAVAADGDADVFADDESDVPLDRTAWRRVDRLAERGVIAVLLAVDPDRLSCDLATCPCWSVV